VPQAHKRVLNKAVQTAATYEMKMKMEMKMKGMYALVRSSSRRNNVASRAVGSFNSYLVGRTASVVHKLKVHEADGL
jgi:hypothetical protein